MIMGGCLSDQSNIKDEDFAFNRTRPVNKSNEPPGINVENQQNNSNLMPSEANTNQISPSHSNQITVEFDETIQCGQWKKKPKKANEIEQDEAVIKRRLAEKNIEQIMQNSLLVKKAYERVNSELNKIKE